MRGSGSDSLRLLYSYGWIEYFAEGKLAEKNLIGTHDLYYVLAVGAHMDDIHTLVS